MASEKLQVKRDLLDIAGRRAALPYPTELAGIAGKRDETTGSEK